MSEEWEKSLKKLLDTPPHLVRQSDVFTLPPPQEDEDVKAVLRKMNQGIELTEDDIKILPDRYREFYFLEQDSLKDEESIARRKQWELDTPERRARSRRKEMIEEKILRKVASFQPLSEEEMAIVSKIKNPNAKQDKKLQILREKKAQARKEKALYDQAIKKLETWQQLTVEERNILKTYRPSKIDLDASEILTDVVNGDYSLQDVHLVSEGANALAKDPTENSPIQLLEQVLESMKKHTQEALQTSNSDQFFKTIDADLLNRITPLQLNEIVSSCKTGIELLQGPHLDDNEAKSACESFIKAMVMSEGENKIREVIKAAEKKQKEMEENDMAEFAAVAAAVVFEDQIKSDEVINLEFNITETECDVTFVPTDDPDVYKPLEIISYVGMTNCK